MLFIPSHSCFLSVKSVPLFEKIAHFREDLFPRKKTQHEGIRKDLCPQMTQMHADIEFGVALLPHLRASASSAGNSEFGCGWPRWVIRGSFLSSCGCQEPPLGNRSNQGKSGGNQGQSRLIRIKNRQYWGGPLSQNRNCQPPPLRLKTPHEQTLG